MYLDELTDSVSDQQTESEEPCYKRVLYDQYRQPYHISRPRALPSGGPQPSEKTKSKIRETELGVAKHISNTPTYPLAASRAKIETTRINQCLQKVARAERGAS